MIAVEYQSVDFIKRFFDLLNDLDADEFKRFFIERDIHDNRNVIFSAALNRNSEVFKFIVDFRESLTTSKEFQEPLMPIDEHYKFRLIISVLENINLDIIIEVLTQKLQGIKTPLQTSNVYLL